MSIWTCLDCTARYAVGLPRCPQCASTKYADGPDGTPKPVALLVGEPGPELIRLPSSSPAIPAIPADYGND